VKHVIICGHYDCGGVNASIDNPPLGLINNWILHVRDVYLKHRSWLEKLPRPALGNKLCELNVAEQVYNLGNSTIMQSAWERGQQVDVHGVVYGIGDGKLLDLGMRCDSRESLEVAYHNTMAKISSDAL
jgi:carbonic anhydrase